jgi:prephenate dehydrogenase
VAEPTLRNLRVVVYGLGLMGGSLALALRNSCASLTAIDPDPATRHLATSQQIVDLILAEPPTAGLPADLVILAAPVRANLALLARLGDLHPGPAVVLDLSSTKAHIVQAMARLPERFDPIGGHPMCGKETGSLAYAEAALFQDAAFALTPLERTSSAARALAEALVRQVGARPLIIEAETHDRWVAATSHTPYLLASALAAATPVEAAPLVGPGFRSTARLAASERRMMLDILLTSRTQVLRQLAAVQGRLADLQAALELGDEKALWSLLEAGARRHAALTGGKGAP